MLFVDCVADFKRYLSSYAAAETIDYYNINLDFFTQFLAKRFLYLDFDINKIQKLDYIDYIAFCRTKEISDTSAATYARAIKRFLKYCFNEGYLNTDITKNVKLPKNDQRMIMPLSQDEIDVLYEKLLDGECGLRNVAMMYLMLDCGLRRSEVVKLNISDVDFDNNYIRIQKSKNRKSRVVPLSENARTYIGYYSDTINVIPEDKNALFLDRHHKNRITNNSVELVFQKVKVMTNIKVYPHLFRHTFATSFILGGGNLEILRILLGHSSYNVTQQYLHIANQTLFTHQKVYQLDPVFFKIYNYNK